MTNYLEEKLTDIQTLRERIKENTKDLYYSTPLLLLDVPNEKVKVGITLTDLLLASAITGTNTLLIGGTGIGKTTITKRVMNALFGEEYVVLLITPNLSEEKFRDIYFGAIKEGKTLQEAIEGSPLTKYPAVLLDEINRAPPQLLSILQEFLTNGTLTFEGGKQIPTGIKIEELNTRYQWKVGTMNEGEEYVGTFDIDKALRSRFSLEINLDRFPPLDIDKSKIVEKSYTENNNKFKDSLLESIIDLYKFTIEKIEIPPMVYNLSLYLMNVSQCPKAPSGTKNVGWSNTLCSGCYILANKNIKTPTGEIISLCPYVKSISPRTVESINKILKGIYLVAMSKIKDYTNPIEINGKFYIPPEWVMETLPLIIGPKIDVDNRIIEDYFFGDKLAFSQILVKESYHWLTNSIRELKEKWGIDLTDGKPLWERSIDEINTLMEYVQKIDPWLLSFNDLKLAKLKKEGKRIIL